MQITPNNFISDFHVFLLFVFDDIFSSLLLLFEAIRRRQIYSVNLYIFDYIISSPNSTYPNLAVYAY